MYLIAIISLFQPFYAVESKSYWIILGMAAWSLLAACLLTAVKEKKHCGAIGTMLAVAATYVVFCVIFWFLPGGFPFLLVLMRTVSFAALSAALEHSANRRTLVICYALTAVFSFVLLFLPKVYFGVYLSGHLFLCAASVYVVEKHTGENHRVSRGVLYGGIFLMAAEQLVSQFALMHG